MMLSLNQALGTMLLSEDEDDDVIFVKEVKHSNGPRMPVNKTGLVEESNIFDKLTLGAFKRLSELQKLRQLDLSDGEGHNQSNVNGVHSHRRRNADRQKDEDVSKALFGGGRFDVLGTKDLFPEKQKKMHVKSPNSLAEDICPVSTKSPVSSKSPVMRKSRSPPSKDDSRKQCINNKLSPSANDLLKTPTSRKRPSALKQDHQAKKPKEDNGIKCISSSPIVRAFYSPSARPKERKSEKVGFAPPLCSTVNPPRHGSSLQPHTFANCQVDMLDGLAEDKIFEESYTNTVLSYTTASVAPPTHVVTHILTKIALSSCRNKSRKAIVTLQNLMSARKLNHRNLSISWDFVCSLSTDLLADLEKECQKDSHANTDSSDLSVDYQSVLTFLVNLLGEDYKMYRNNIRETICWKLLSPSIFGSSRLNKIMEWLTKSLQMIDDNQLIPDSTLNGWTIRVGKFISTLQRLFNLVYQTSRNPQDTADQLAELFLGCFFDTSSLSSRKRLLSAIEPVVVQRKTVEMIITTICESTERSRELEKECISLQKITGCFFNKEPPLKNTCARNSIGHTPEEIEEFAFLLYILSKSYLMEKHDTAMKNMASLSLVDSVESCTTQESTLSLRDRKSWLTIQEDISSLKNRLESRTTKLSPNTLLHLKMISKLFAKPLC